MADSITDSGVAFQDPQWSAVDAAVGQLEELWNAGSCPELAPLLPQPRDAKRMVVLIELIKVDQERRWKAGLKKPLEEYLVEWPEFPRKQSVLLELLAAELQTRVAFDTLPSAKELQERFSEFPAEQIQEMLREAHDCKLPHTITHTPPTPGKGSGLTIRCPSCHTPMPVAADTKTDVTCSGCGNKIVLVDPQPDSPPIASVGRFIVSGRVGLGGFGTVWKAHDPDLDRPVAIKIPRGMTVEGQVRFLREAQTAAQLRHPNIVSVYEVGRDGELLFIISDFIEGKTLNEWWKSHRPSDQRIVKLCLSIADALQYAHEQKIVHRDIKPANIMVDVHDQPHLMDFGLARRDARDDSLTLDGQLVGTPEYMSPEQARGEAHNADARSDIYAFGVLLFELLTGRLPFRGSKSAVMQQVIHAEPPPPRSCRAELSRDLETVILKCLEKLPDNRYQCIQDVASDLNCYLCGEPIEARPIRNTTRLWRWTRQRPAFALSVVCGILLITVISQIYEWHPIRYGLTRYKHIMRSRSLLYDDFEGYGWEMWPSNWTRKWNSLDASNNGIVSDLTNPENHVLKLFGTDTWSASATRPVNFPSAFAVHARIYNYGNSQPRRSGWGRGSMSIENVTTLFTFFADGNVNLGGIVVPYQTEHWYDVQVHYRHNSGNPVAQYWLDNTYVGEASLSLPNPHAALTHLELNGGSSAYFDDVEVTPISDTP